jgi:16S rRNA (guanine527-N7)-methyltransferase
VFRKLLAGYFPLPDDRLELLEKHYELLLRWNKTLNLTRVERLEEAVERHYAESLFLGSHLPAGPLRIADIGSGPGFPGIPVAVLRSESSVTLIESHQRKAVFLKEATRGLTNVRVVAKRAEEVKEEFDWAVSRAVSYEDLRQPLRRLAPRAALLMGGDPPPEKLGFDWNEPILVPWGKQRFLLVSRKTGG